MRAYAYASRYDADAARDYLRDFGLRTELVELPADDGVDGWLMWEVRVDELPAQRLDTADGVARALEDEAEYEHDAGRSTLWDEQHERDDYRARD